MKKIKDPKFIKWLHFQECLVCGVVGTPELPNHPHHFWSKEHTRRGDDTKAGSLCWYDHNGHKDAVQYNKKLERSLVEKQQKQRAKYEGEYERSNR